MSSKGGNMDSVGLFIVGIGVGTYIPASLPAPLDTIRPFIGLIFVIIGILLMMRK